MLERAGHNISDQAHTLTALENAPWTQRMAPQASLDVLLKHIM